MIPARLRFACLLALPCLVATPTLTARPTAPDWLAAAAAAPATVSTKNVDAVVLLHEREVELVRDGQLRTHTRFAIRVHTGEGREHARAPVEYLFGSGEVKSLKAWLIKPSGEVVAYAKRDTLDIALHTTALELYGEARMKLITARQDAAPGAVFGYEAEVAEKTILMQQFWPFQDELPVERASFTMRLPPGWRLTTHVFNHPPITPTIQGASQTWTLTGLESATPEPMGPPSQALIPRLGIDLIPPGETAASSDRLVCRSWDTIAAYFSPRYDAAAQADAALHRQAAALTANATTPWARIHALCRHAQQVNYISIFLNAANAGGYIPRPATRVLQCNYGDCKDKATLLRALLASQGVVSYPLIVAAAGEKDIRENWPSPTQFNHCILAVTVDDTVNVPAIITHPTLGRLMIFDPTNQFTPVGQIDDRWLARQGLLLAGGHSGLVTLPRMPPEGNRLERRLTARLDARGGLTGTVHEEFFGQASTRARAEQHQLDQENYRKAIERWLAATLPAPRAPRVETKDNFDEARFILDADFESRGYGKLMQDKLLIFKPVLVARRNSTPLRKEPRTQPVVLQASRYTEHAEIELPEGFTVDENIAPVTLETAFGRYTAKAAVVGRQLVFERALDLSAAEIPAADYEQVRTFFEQIIRSEQNPAVLRRQ